MDAFQDIFKDLKIGGHKDDISIRWISENRKNQPSRRVIASDGQSRRTEIDGDSIPHIYAESNDHRGTVCS